MDSLPVWAPYEEFWNSLTHGVMIPVSIHLTYKLIKQTIFNSKLKSCPYNEFTKENSTTDSNTEKEEENNENSENKENSKSNQKENENEINNMEEIKQLYMDKIKKLSAEDLKKKQERTYLYGKIDKQRIIGCILYGITMR